MTAPADPLHQAFEAWYMRRFPNVAEPKSPVLDRLPHNKTPISGWYRDENVQREWLIFEAGARWAIETCAILCDERAARYQTEYAERQYHGEQNLSQFHIYITEADEIAESIRALLPPSEE
jgi:hypothetical protein